MPRGPTLCSAALRCTVHCLSAAVASLVHAVCQSGRATRRSPQQLRCAAGQHDGLLPKGPRRSTDRDGPLAAGAGDAAGEATGAAVASPNSSREAGSTHTHVTQVRKPLSGKSGDDDVCDERGGPCCCRVIADLRTAVALNRVWVRVGASGAREQCVGVQVLVPIIVSSSRSQQQPPSRQGGKGSDTTGTWQAATPLCMVPTVHARRHAAARCTNNSLIHSSHWLLHAARVGAWPAQQLAGKGGVVGVGGGERRAQWKAAHARQASLSFVTMHSVCMQIV